MVVSESGFVTHTLTLTAELEAIKHVYLRNATAKPRLYNWLMTSRDCNTPCGKAKSCGRTAHLRLGDWRHIVAKCEWRQQSNGEKHEIKGKRKRHTSTAQTQHTENRRQHLHRQTIAYEDWLYTKIKINFMQCNQQYTNIKQCIEQQMFTQCKYRSI